MWLCCPHLGFALDLGCIIRVACGYLEVKQELAVAIVTLIWLDGDFKVHWLLLAFWEVDVDVARKRQLRQICSKDIASCQAGSGFTETDK